MRRRPLYRQLKLAGLKEAPVHLAVFSDEDPEQGHGLWAGLTMPETLAYSTVSMIHTLLAGRTRGGIGVGWVSILDPETVTRISFRLTAAGGSWLIYVLGFPEEEQHRA